MRLPSQEWKVRVLKFGLLIVDHDPETALTFFRRVPDVLSLQGSSEDTTVFDTWFGQGMAALEYSIEAGWAFFALETRQACAVVEEALSGVPLRQVARSLKMFAMALCGQEVMLEPFPERGGGESSRQTGMPMGFRSCAIKQGELDDSSPAYDEPLIHARGKSTLVFCHGGA